MTVPTLGLGILSWHGYDTLRASLETYPQTGFLDLFSERVIYFPEITDQGRDLANQFGFQAKGQPDNLGILNGFKGLAESMTAEHVLLLENDCPLVESVSEAKRQIDKAQQLISCDRAEIVRMRSRRDPGEAFDTAEKYRKIYPSNHAMRAEKIRAAITRTLRPGKAKKLIGTAVYVESAPAEKFPDYIVEAGDKFYLAPPSVVTWTNQSILLPRDFFLQIIIARAEAVSTKRRVNGFKNLEIELNDSWWQSRPWKIGIAPGLFTHRRLGNRGY